jgi:hypothetical protein
VNSTLVLLIKPYHSKFVLVGVFKLLVLHVVLCCALLLRTELLQGLGNDLLIDLFKVKVTDTFLQDAVAVIKVSTNNFGVRTLTSNLTDVQAALHHLILRW